MALAWGCPVDSVLAQLTTVDLMEFYALWLIDPWSQERADRRAGIIAATVANVNVTNKSGKAFEVEEFMPIPPPGYEPPKPLTWEQSRDIFAARATRKKVGR